VLLDGLLGARVGDGAPELALVVVFVVLACLIAALVWHLHVSCRE
jgi:hypothetical protein